MMNIVSRIGPLSRFLSTRKVTGDRFLLQEGTSTVVTSVSSPLEKNARISLQ